jgi:hypothetical protein
MLSLIKKKWDSLPLEKLINKLKMLKMLKILKVLKTFRMLNNRRNLIEEECDY